MAAKLTKAEVLAWLYESDPRRCAVLYKLADQTRRDHVGNAVHLRGLIEISNQCSRQCLYCGLRAGNQTLMRYRMSREEIRQCALMAQRLGYGTVVLQAGEDFSLDADWVAETTHAIKHETSLAVTLSLGERYYEELKLWRSCGADRYLLRFESSDTELYATIHPPRIGTNDTPRHRIAILQELKSLGYETGGGIMVGIPGQSLDSLADDIALFQRLDLDMIGIGPYIAHPATPLGNGTVQLQAEHPAASSEEMVCKVLALARLACPEANLPSTTALATLNRTDGRKHGLCAGANVVMPNLTPIRYRKLYEIYPGKACIEESAETCHQCLRGQIGSLGLSVADGPGFRLRRNLRIAAASIN